MEKRNGEKDLNIWVGGKYRMIKKIGEGSFGEIYLGECLRQKRVAIKLVCHFLFHTFFLGKQQDREEFAVSGSKDIQRNSRRR